MVWLLSCKILLNQVVKFTMCITILIIRLLTPYYGQKPKLLVPIPMHREIASINAFTLQIYLHAAIPDNAVILMIDAFYLIKHRLFLA